MIENCDNSQAVKCEGRLSRIETNIDHVLVEVRELREGLREGIETRLKRLEVWQSWVLGAGAVIGVALTIFGNVLIAKLSVKGVSVYGNPKQGIGMATKQS